MSYRRLRRIVLAVLPVGLLLMAWVAVRGAPLPAVWVPWVVQGRVETTAPADLAVLSLEGEAAGACNLGPALYARVANQGQLQAKDFAVRFQGTGLLCGSVPIAHLDPGEEVLLRCPAWQTVSGTFTVIADPDNRVKEENLRNNVLSTHLTLSSAPTCTPTPTPTPTPRWTATPTPSPSPTPTHTPTPAWVVLRSTSHYVSADGQWINVVGEVENVSDVPVGPVRVIVEYQSAAGELLGQDVTYALLDPIFPGQRAPFHVIDEMQGAGPISYTVEAAGFPVTAEPLTPLRLLDSEVFTDAVTGNPVLVGELESPLDVPIARLRIPITLYDAQGRVVNVVQAAPLRDVVPAQGRVPFRVQVDQGPQDMSDWRWEAQYEVAGESELATGLQLRGLVPYIDGENHLIIQGYVANRGTKRANFVRVVGTLYDKTGHLLNATFSYPLTYHVRPGESILFELTFREHFSGWADYRVVVGDMR